MSEILGDFVTIVKLFTAAVMCVAGILLAVCYCCCLRDVDDSSELGVADLGKKTFDGCTETEESKQPGDDALAQKKSFKNKCYTVEDETKSPGEHPKNSARF